MAHSRPPSIFSYVRFFSFWRWARTTLLVTFPFVMLLLDFWPLNRFPGAALSDRGRKRHLLMRLVLEKIPLLALSAASSVSTFWVQKQSGALRPLDAVPLGVRVANALISYVQYIGKMFWPVDLAVLYPYPSGFNPWKVASAFFCWQPHAFSVGCSFGDVSCVGWFWYLGTLIPVIGLVQVGIQSMADRYTYIPLIGIGIIMAWSGAELIKKFPRVKTALLALTAAVWMLMTAATLRQVRYWKDR